MANAKTLIITLAATLLTSPTLAQTTTSSSSFNWDSLISAAGTSLTSFDLYTTNGSLGPGVLDTSSRAGLYSSPSVTPVIGPIGNGTVANGTATNATATMSSGAGTGATGGGSGGGGGSGSNGGAGASSGSSAGASAPAETGNVASGGGPWVGGAAAIVGLGVVMAAL